MTYCGHGWMHVPEGQTRWVCKQCGYTYESDGSGVIRYVPTFVNQDGQRVMLGAKQGRNTHETPEAAEQYLQAVLSNNNREMLEGLFGDLSKLEVRPVECWAGHFDPIGIYFPLGPQIL